MIEIFSIEADFIVRKYHNIGVRELGGGEYQAVIINVTTGRGIPFSKFRISNYIPAEEIERTMNEILDKIAERQMRDREDVFFWASFIKICISQIIENREMEFRRTFFVGDFAKESK